MICNPKGLSLERTPSSQVTQTGVLRKDKSDDSANGRLRDPLEKVQKFFIAVIFAKPTELSGNEKRPINYMLIGLNHLLMSRLGLEPGTN